MSHRKFVDTDCYYDCWNYLTERTVEERTALIPFVTFLGLARIVIGIRREIKIGGRGKSIERGKDIERKGGETRGRLGRNLRERNESFIHSN